MPVQEKKLRRRRTRDGRWDAGWRRCCRECLAWCRAILRERITVLRPGAEGRYVLRTGVRRIGASKLAGKEKMPAIVRHVSEQQAAEMTVIENLQRQDLNCMEQAYAFAKLSQDFKMTQEQTGERV